MLREGADLDACGWFVESTFMNEMERKSNC
jgi:hypothetical protein